MMSPCCVKNISCVLCALASLTFATWVYAANESDQDPKLLAPHVLANSSWSLRLPQDGKVVYKGLVSFDNAGQKSGQLLYPAPNAVGFLAAILTHGLVVESQKKNEKEQLQLEADNVLVPYQVVLNEYTNKALMQRGMHNISMGGRKIIEFTEKSDTGWFIDSAPVFFITQDQSAIILDNAVSISAPDAATAAYQKIIRVVSEPQNVQDYVKLWTEQQGEELKKESANLFALSLEIAMKEMANLASSDDVSQRTFRYLEGKVEKIERGYLVSENCNRMVIKTLRGQFISVPVRRDIDSNPSIAEQCNDTLKSAM